MRRPPLPPYSTFLATSLSLYLPRYLRLSRLARSFTRPPFVPSTHSLPFSGEMREEGREGRREGGREGAERDPYRYCKLLRQILKRGGREIPLRRICLPPAQTGASFLPLKTTPHPPTHPPPPLPVHLLDPTPHRRVHVVGAARRRVHRQAPPGRKLQISR